MGIFDKCAICGEYGFTDTHRCPPRFDVRDFDDDPGDWTKVYAMDAERAAEKFCEKSDAYQAEFHSERTVIVRDAQGVYLAYEVYGEMVPSYSAHRADRVEIVKAPEDQIEPEEETEGEQ